MDINEASAEQLENAFQVDGVRARYIVDRRDKRGPFQSWEDVKQVPGFEDKMAPSPLPTPCARESAVGGVNHRKG
jgi:DNA uptake protein ComE-like DNA-binding protein